MPCESGPSYSDDYYERLQLATRAACELARLLKKELYLSQGWEVKVSKQTRRWVRIHDKIDRQRIAREKKEKKERHERVKALKKLTPREIEILRIRA